VAIDVIHDFNQEALRGHIHLVKSGPVQAIGIQTDALHSTAPTLLFLPRPNTHRLLTDEKSGADVVCATVQFGGGGKNRITDSLPGIVLVELADHRLAKTLSAIHDDPACARDLSSMAALADMSRAHFALRPSLQGDHGRNAGGLPGLVAVDESPGFTQTRTPSQAHRRRRWRRQCQCVHARLHTQGGLLANQLAQ
jgi:hypothetical protein